MPSPLDGHLGRVAAPNHLVRMLFLVSRNAVTGSSACLSQDPGDILAPEGASALQPDRPGFESWLCCALAVWLWVRSFASLGLGFVILTWEPMQDLPPGVVCSVSVGWVHVSRYVCKGDIGPFPPPLPQGLRKASTCIRGFPEGSSAYLLHHAGTSQEMKQQ